MEKNLKELVDAAEKFVAQGNWEAAEHAYARLGESCPLEPDVRHLHGLVLMARQQWAMALKQIDCAISMQPENGSYYRSRGDVLKTLGDLDGAVESYKLALERDPLDDHAMINLGNTMHRQDQMDQALYWYQRAVSINPSNPQASNNIGKTLYDQGKLEPALDWYGKALACEPHYAEARFNRAVAMLALGDYDRGWPEYEWRFKRQSAKHVYPHELECPRWDGTGYAGKHLLIHCEQGMGDVIQFCRYLPQVKALGGTLTVEVHPPLAPLLGTMNAVDQVVAFDPQRPPLGEYDLHLPLLSLPLVFQTTLDSIPNHVPYLRAPASLASKWKADIKAISGLRVGIVWSGSATDPRRSCPFDLVQELTVVPDTFFFSLQKDLPPEQTEKLHWIKNLIHWGDRLSHFDDTAAAIDNLDLVISVDTATAHLAGAMGKPVWILLPCSADWRWLTERENNPWYPSARLFRQSSNGQWAPVIRKVLSALVEISETRKASQASAPLEIYAAQATDLFWQTPMEKPNRVEDLFNLGCDFHERHQLEQAISCYEKALTLNPDLEAAYRNLGWAWYQTGDLSKAAASYKQVLRLSPHSIDMLISLGAIYARTGQSTEAEAFYRSALEIDPGHEAALYNLGNLYLKTAALDSAAEQFRRVLSKNPQHTKALCNLGRTCHRMGEVDMALRLYEEALNLEPEEPVVHLNRGVALLLKGQWSEGWKEYEWRLKCDVPRPIYPHRLTGCRWDGETFRNQTLLVHGEQGLGDAIQFVRFLPMVKAHGGRVVLETHASLMKLFETLDGVDQIVELSSHRAPKISYDKYIPLCSLAGLFGVTPGNIPGTIHYLHADPQKAAQWHSRLASGRLTIGITWAGSDTYPERSCSLKDFGALGHIPGINWIGLQKGPAAKQAADVSGFKITNWGDEFRDFSDTAAAMANLDLIISIDTSVAHLAGAMGKPVWLLLPKIPDWRWLLQRSDTPWYSTMQLFRQKNAGDWSSVMQDIAIRLGRADFF